MDDTLCDYTSAWKQHRNQHPSIKFPQSQPGFFENLVPLPGAIDSLNTLFKSECYECYILTAPSYMNPHSYTEKRLWIEKHLGIQACKKLVISLNKGLHKGDYLIDDWDHGKGQESFEGEIIHFGTDLFPDWKAVIRYLNEIA